MGTPQPSDQFSPSVAIERTLQDLYAERRAIADRAAAARQTIASLEARDAELIRAIEGLLPLLDAHRRPSFPVPERPAQKTGHGTDAYANIISLVQRYPNRSWTAPDMQTALEAEGVRADLKQVYNILAYLQKGGRLERIDRGKYRLRDLGAGLVSSDDIPGTDDGGACS